MTHFAKIINNDLPKTENNRLTPFRVLRTFTDMFLIWFASVGYLFIEEQKNYEQKNYEQKNLLGRV